MNSYQYLVFLHMFECAYMCTITTFNMYRGEEIFRKVPLLVSKSTIHSRIACIASTACLICKHELIVSL